MSKLESVKNHLRRNKVTYIACGVTAVVVAGTTYYFTRNGSAVKAVAATTEFFGETVINNAPKQVGCYKPVMNNTIEMVERSTPSKAVALLDKDGGIRDIFCSLSEAARKTGRHLSMISQNVNHHIDNVGGERFVLVSELVEAA